MADYYEKPLTTGGITTWDEFNLKCRVKTYTKSWEEPADDNRLHQAEVIVLIPDSTATETWKFMTAWKPDVAEPRTFEFAMFLGPPVLQPARGAYQLPNKWVQEDHIFLMNAALEYDIKRLIAQNRKLVIPVVVYGEDSDHQADSAPDLDKSVDSRFVKE